MIEKYCLNNHICLFSLILRAGHSRKSEGQVAQTGIVLRTQWKEELDKIGYDKSWKVTTTTNAAKNKRSARCTGRHEVDYKFCV